MKREKCPICNEYPEVETESNGISTICNGCAKIRPNGTIKRNGETMFDFDFGPEWVWKTLAGLAAIGGLAVIIGIIWGITWMIQHVHFY